MKTSNILIGIAIAGAFVYVTLNIFAAKNKMMDNLDSFVVNNNNEVEEEVEQYQSKDLDGFAFVKISKGAKVSLVASTENKLMYKENANIANIHISNDTLVLSGKDINVTVEIKDIQGIKVSGKAWATLADLQTEELKIDLFDKATFQATDLDINNLNLYPNDDANVKIIRSIAKNVFLQAEEYSNVELLCKMQKISGTTAPDTRLVMTTVKNISLQANGGLEMVSERY